MKLTNAYTKADNEPSQLKYSLEFDSTVNSLSLVHEPNELIELKNKFINKINLTQHYILCPYLPPPSLFHTH